jgi:fused signal recognition particle receptor
VLTKLDGTAKGGVVLGVANGLRVPVRYVGLGERPDDLHEFSPEDFVEALLGREESSSISPVSSAAGAGATSSSEKAN